jgi:hypothetical protein
MRIYIYGREYYLDPYFFQWLFGEFGITQSEFFGLPDSAKLDFLMLFTEHVREAIHRYYE